MKKFMRKKYSLKNLIALFSLCVLSLNINAKIELLDKVIAVVDSGVIMETQLNARVEEVLLRLQTNKAELPPLNLLEEQVLERLIIEEIQMQIADRAGIKISDSELNQTLSRIAAQNNLSLEEFRVAIEQDGGSYKAFRETIRKELIIGRVQRGKVGSRVDISEQEIENFINSEEGRTELAEQYDVQHILVSVKSGLNENELSLKVGETSELIRSGAGFHILRLNDKRGNTVKFMDQTLSRHILVQPSEIRTENQAEVLIRDIHRRLLQGEDFKQLARQYSEDPGSKMDGGNLGWANPGEYDPAFEKTLNATEIGEISEPVKSTFGWHIVEVLDRRNEDVSQEEQKNRAYQIIYERKFEQELESTLIELRAEAYVDIKLTS